MEKLQPTRTADRNEMVQLLWKSVLQLLKKVNIELLYDPAIPLLDTYPKECKQVLSQIVIHQCLQQHCPQQPKGRNNPSGNQHFFFYCLPNKWVNKMHYIHTMEYYSATKMNEVLIYVTMQMNLEDIMLRERSQTRKITYCMVPFI